MVVQSGDVLGGFPCMDARSRQANALDLQIMSVEISWTWSIASECRHDAGKDFPWSISCTKPSASLQQVVVQDVRDCQRGRIAESEASNPIDKSEDAACDRASCTNTQGLASEKALIRRQCSISNGIAHFVHLTGSGHRLETFLQGHWTSETCPSLHTSSEGKSWWRDVHGISSGSRGVGRLWRRKASSHFHVS